MRHVTRRLLRPLVALLTALAAIVALAVVPPVDGIHAATYQTSNWEAEGTVTSTGEPAPNVPYATGSFSMNDLTRVGGNISDATAPDGSVDVYVHANTKFLRDSNGDGVWESSSQESTVVVGARVFVAGRYHRSDDQQLLFANYVWSPPPTEKPAPPPPGPEPRLPADMLLNRAYGVWGNLYNPSASLLGVRTKLFGFELTDVVQRCAAEFCHVDAIAAAKRNTLTFREHALTQYHVQNPDGTYTTTDDRYLAIESRGIGADMFVTGRYHWNGMEWVFYASHVFSPPPEAQATGPLGPYAGTVFEEQQGTYDESSGIWSGAEWTGTMDMGGEMGLARITMTLDFFKNPAGYWDFTGTYRVETLVSPPTGLAGDISGTVTTGALGSVDATLTIEEAFGRFDGRQGYGSFTGGASYTPGSTGEVTPPVQARGSFLWQVTVPS